MNTLSYQALVVQAHADGSFTRSIQRQETNELPAGELLVRVAYSSLNYKDMLSATGNRGVTKSYPHVPGIDAAGVVVEAEGKTFVPGDAVIVTSYELGMNTPGGFGEYIRVPAAWALHLPEGLSLRDSMILGTAGLTAGMCIEKITATRRAEEGEILVTGATGGVGSLAVALLAKLGYTVAAVTGKEASHDFLKDLGAATVLSRDALTDDAKRPLLKARWAGVVDTIGSTMLSAAIKSTQPRGVVTSCGNAASGDLPLTVYPFILRGITLAGIDSQHCPHALRESIWQKLGGAWKIDTLDRLVTEIPLEELSDSIDRMAAGTLQGRVLLRHDLSQG